MVENFQKCKECGSALSDQRRHCPACNADAGPPNIRLVQNQEFIKRLEESFFMAQERATLKGLAHEFDTTQELVRTVSCLVVSLPPDVARYLVSNKKSMYVNYESLVGSGSRLPAVYNDDRLRRSVAGILFGEFAKEIVYGALSMTGIGLPTYGAMQCKLKEIAVSKRTTFLIENSYNFVGSKPIKSVDMAGWSSDWDNRDKLVMAKIGDSVSQTPSTQDVQNLIIRSDGVDREKDEFIEGHIYGGFNLDAIESMEIYPGIDVDRSEKNDAKLAMKGMEAYRKGSAF